LISDFLQQIAAGARPFGPLLRVMGMALMNVIPVVATIFGAAYAVQPGYRVQMDRSVDLWIPVVGNIVAVIVIPFVGALSDRIGRRPYGSSR
jgi:MFS family permease